MHALATSSDRVEGYLWDVVSDEREEGKEEKVGERRGRCGREEGRGEKYLAKRSWMYARPVGQVMGPLEDGKQAGLT
jgi:hypothetical protein